MILTLVSIHTWSLKNDFESDRFDNYPIPEMLELSRGGNSNYMRLNSSHVTTINKDLLNNDKLIFISSQACTGESNNCWEVTS